MAKWRLQDARAHLSALIHDALNKGPQVVTRRGSEIAVVVSIDEWRRLQNTRPTLKDVLLADKPRFDIPLPKRRRLRSRAPVMFD